MSRIGVVVRQFLCLLVDGVGHFGAAIADVDAIESRERIDVALALMVFDANALCARHDLARQRAACVDGCMKWLRSCLNSCSSWVIWVISFSLGYKPRRCLATPGSVLPASSADKTKSSADCTDAHRRAQTRTDGGALHRSRPVQDSCITSTCRHCRKASTGCDIGQWQPQIAEAKIFGFDKR